MEKSNPVDRGTMMKAAAAHVLAAVSRFDPEALRAVMAPDVVLDNPYAPPEFGPARYDGLDAIVAMMGNMPKILRSFLWSMNDCFYCPQADSIFVRATGAGTLHNGRKYLNEYVLLFAFRGDKIIRMTDYNDSIKVRELFVNLALP